MMLVRLVYVFSNSGLALSECPSLLGEGKSLAGLALLGGVLKLTLTPSDGLRLESKPSHENGESSMQLEIQSIDEVQRRVDQLAR